VPRTAVASVTTWDYVRSLDGGVVAALHKTVGTPVTSRSAWWRAVGAAVGGTPVLITLPGWGDAVAAAALVVLHERDGLWELTSGRLYGDDVWEPAAVSPAARRALLAGIADFARNLGRRWHLRLRGLRDRKDAEWLAAHLPNCCIESAPAVPGIRFTPGTELPFSDGVRRSLVRSGRRIRQAKLREEIGFEREAARLSPLRSEIEAVHLARDDDAGWVSDLDDPAKAEFWRAMYVLHVDNGELEVATLRLDSELAAYVVGLDDHPAYRVVAGRYAPKWRKYSPGRRLEAWVAERVRDDGFRELDWGSSVAPEKVIARNFDDPRWTITAARDPYLSTSELGSDGISCEHPSLSFLVLRGRMRCDQNAHRRRGADQDIVHSSGRRADHCRQLALLFGGPPGQSQATSGVVADLDGCDDGRRDPGVPGRADPRRLLHGGVRCGVRRDRRIRLAPWRARLRPP
jgi:Acetyltransferase (GNAT) domain